MKLQTRNTIILQKYYLYSCIIPIIICASHLALGNDKFTPPPTRRCPSSFTNPSHLEAQIYTLADTADQIKQRVIILFHTQETKKDRWIKDMEKIADRLLEYLENGRIRELPFQRVEAFLKHREWQIGQEERSTYTQPTNSKPNGKDVTWDMLVENPALVQPNHPYTLQFVNSTFFHHIIFNSKVIDQFFTEGKTYDKKLAKKFLTTIRKGFINNRDSDQLSGIKRLDTNKSNKYNDIIEVKTISAHSGHIRLGGFLIGNTIHITDYLQSSNHTQITTKRFTDRLEQQLQVYSESPELALPDF